MTWAPRSVTASKCTMSEIVLPNDTNSLGNLFGGRLLQWMDICAAISAQRHTGRVCVTAAVDTVEFHSPIRQGEIVVLESLVNRAFNTSMEVEINVWAEYAPTLTRRKCNRAYYTFVSLDDHGKPQPVPPIAPEGDDEHARYEAAAQRREFRLLLAGRLKPGEATRTAQLLREIIGHESP